MDRDNINSSVYVGEAGLEGWGGGRKHLGNW